MNTPAKNKPHHNPQLPPPHPGPDPLTNRIRDPKNTQTNDREDLDEREEMSVVGCISDDFGVEGVVGVERGRHDRWSL